MNMITIGGATQDIFFMAEHDDIQRSRGEHGTYLMLPEGAKIISQDVHIATGGGATNAAAIAAQLGVHVDVCCMVGHDAAAAFVRDELTRYDIATTHIRTTEQAHTAISCVVPSSTGSRTILVYRGANAYFTPDHLPQNMQMYDGAYITSQAQQAAQHITSVAQRAHTHNYVAHNPGSEELQQYPDQLCNALQHIDMFIVNAREACYFLQYLSQDPACKQRLQQYTSHQAGSHAPELLHSLDPSHDIACDIRAYMQEIMRHGPQIVVVTNGSEGVYVGHNSTLYFGPAPETDIVCSVGAGDACGSTLFTLWLNGASIRQALAGAIDNSCRVLQTIDAKRGSGSYTSVSNATTEDIAEYPL